MDFFCSALLPLLVFIALILVGLYLVLRNRVSSRHKLIRNLALIFGLTSMALLIALLLLVQRVEKNNAQLRAKTEARTAIEKDIDSKVNALCTETMDFLGSQEYKDVLIPLLATVNTMPPDSSYDLGDAGDNYDLLLLRKTTEWARTAEFIQFDADQAGLFKYELNDTFKPFSANDFATYYLGNQEYGGQGDSVVREFCTEFLND